MRTYLPTSKKGSRLLWGMALATSAIVAHGQSPATVPESAAVAGPANRRVLNVTALDEQGRPVTDLTSADFQVFDGGKPEKIADFFPPLPPAPGKAASTTLILFDLLNSTFRERENTVTLIVQALQPLETGNSIFLYLLTNHGDLVPVHSLGVPQHATVSRPGSGDQKPPDSPWTQQVRPLLDQAIEKVNAVRIQDYKDQGVRVAATFLALHDLGTSFMKIPGAKTIVWLTGGTPNWVDYPYGCKDVPFSTGSEGYVGGRCTEECSRRPGVVRCIDYTPFLMHFGDRLARTDTTFSSVILSLRGELRPSDRGRARDTLQQLADVSGGHVYLHGESDQAITESLQEGRARYQLSYDAPRPDGKYHEVLVECSRKSVHVQAPQGYYASEQPKQK
jgi:VWFA-related protein